MKKLLVIGGVLIALAVVVVTVFGPRAHQRSPTAIGSKAFTESVVLGEIAAQAVNRRGGRAWHRAQLGGTRVLWEALLADEIGAYPEYTGTIAQELLTTVPADAAAMGAALAEQGVGMTRPLGFNNTYALGMREDRAAELDIRTISDLRKHPQLRYGFSNEFLDRKDCWPAVRQRYDLAETSVRGLDHDIAYRAIASGDLDVVDLYSTDAEIAFHKLRVLRDDLGVFPEYQAVFLYRLQLRDLPEVIESLERLQGAIDENRMIALNAKAKIARVPEKQVAAEFVANLFGGTAGVDRGSRLRDLWRHTLEHLDLVGRSLSAAIALGVPLGVIAARARVGGQLLIGAVSAVYTIPSLALLVFMIPLFGIGKTPATVALFLYSLLPIVRNTHAGLTNLAPPLRDSAEALGLSRWTRLTRIELPLAGPSILAGIKTAAVINVGTATIGALIGAGGYGQPILTGIRLADNELILLGAVPAAVMALTIQGAFELVEWWWLRRLR